MTTNNAQPQRSGDTPPADIIKTEIHLPSILGYEKIARKAAEALAEEIALAPDRIEDLKTAVAEACMNAIEHGNRLESDIHVTVIMLISADKLEVRVADVGHQSIPEKLPAPGVSAPMRGWGMFLIKNLVDEMVIKRLPDGGNEVRMVIRLTPVAHQAANNNSGAVAPAEKKPDAVPSTEQKPSAVQTAGQKPSAVTPAGKKPSALTPTDKKPSAVQPTEQKPSAVVPAGDKPSDIQPTEKTPRAVTPTKQQPGADIGTKTDSVMSSSEE